MNGVGTEWHGIKTVSVVGKLGARNSFRPADTASVFFWRNEFRGPGRPGFPKYGLIPCHSVRSSRINIDPGKWDVKMKAKVEILLLGILTFFAMQPQMLAAAVEPAGDLRVALKYVGINRSELETALREAKGEDTEYLISHASQYDLVNLTAEQIIENVTCARAVHEALPYLGEKLDDGLWREWVLPQRVLEENLCPWRKDFYERMKPVVAGKKTTQAVADAIIEWLWIPDEKGESGIRFGKAENRTKTPLQMLALREGACGELNGVYVSLLRAVGIPARLCQAGWWYHKNDRHFYCEYWDNQLKQWTPWDSSDNLALRSATPRARQASGAWNSLVMHAQPGYPSKPDLLNTESWEDCIRVTAHVGETYEVGLETPGEWDTAKAFVWNHGTWRCIDVASKARGVSRFEFGVTQRIENPVLFTATDGKTLYWGMKRAGKGMGPVKLEKMELGVCLKWEMGKD